MQDKFLLDKKQKKPVRYRTFAFYKNIGYNNVMNEDDKFEDKIEKVIPFMRIYISAGLENHDMLDCEEVAMFLSSDGKSINETIKDLLDKGMVNVYACSFADFVKVI